MRRNTKASDEAWNNAITNGDKLYYASMSADAISPTNSLPLQAAVVVKVFPGNRMVAAFVHK